ncbi:MAG: ribonuclease P protein component [Oscillospiraceae bacterium]|nr:ribonuclease P protein component [Oscillospiraceae bacterium]
MKETVSLKKNYEFRRLYDKGAKAAMPRLVLYCRKSRGGKNRLGLTVGKKTGKAVVRNRVRRRLREIYRLNEQRLVKGVDIVIVARTAAVSATFRELEEDFLRAANKLGLFSEA